MEVERRQNNRIMCDFEILLPGNPSVIKVRNGNISQGGLFFRSSRSFSPMTLYEISFKLPFSSKVDNCVFCKGLVVWSKREAGRYGTAFSFYDISKQDKKKVKEFIEEKTKNGNQ